MTFADLCERMTWEEFLEQAALERLHPIPDPWHQTGVLSATAFNLARTFWEKKGQRANPPRAPEDFMPIEKPQPKAMSCDEFLMRYRAQPFPVPSKA